MTGPRRADRDSGLSLSPVRRRGTAIAPEGYADAEVARGQADAVLGALGRMQLRLDMLAREQSDSLAAVLQILEQVLDRLNDLEAAPAGVDRHDPS